MNAADFLYHYSKDYLQDYVKASLMIENWTDKDCLPPYKNYIGDYNMLKNFLNNKSNANVMAALNHARETRLNHIYNYLFDDVKKRLKRKKGHVSPEKLNMLNSRLSPYRLLKDVDFKYIFELRKIEEEEY